MKKLIILFIFLAIIFFACQKRTAPDNTPPTVNITQPVAGDTLSAPITIKADAFDDDEVSNVKCYIDGAKIGEDNEEPYEFYWNVIFWADDEVHTIQVKAQDLNGNVGVSELIAVIVSEDAAGAVQLIVPENGGFFFENTPIEFIWQNIENASNYIIFVSSDENFENIEFSFTIPDTSVVVDDLDHGVHYWKVKALNISTGYEVWSSVSYFYIGIMIFEKTFGGIGQDYGQSVAQTEDEGYIITGYTSSFGAGETDVWLIKTNVSGNEQWSKTFGGSGQDYGLSVAQTVDKGYIITGYTRSFGSGGEDVWLIKVDSLGNEQWNQTFGGTDMERGQSVAQTEDDGYIITGYTSSFGAGETDVWLIKTDSDGNEQWNQIYGGDDIERGHSGAQTADGGYIIAGYAGSYGPQGECVWLIKTDSSGNEEWNQTFDGYNHERGFSVAQTADEGYIICGYTNSYGAGGADAWLIKTDNSGIEQWNNTFGGSEWDYGLSACQTIDEGYIITGFTYSYGSGQTDLWLIKTDSDGSEDWIKTFGGIEWDYGQSVSQAEDGGYIITGYSSSYGAGQGDFDLLLIKTDENGNVE
ncbi:MAG: Ig-like domain-containing protein [Armatimonadetes bacterium]|nr:Ig-like domain-containing protein [Armatimonadota bacterium]